MKLVIIYGPPAAGKLTIAQSLAKISDIRIFDNHQVIDMIEPLVTRSYPDFAKLIYQTQRNIIEAAVRANKSDIVLTFPYASNLDRDITFMTELTTLSRNLGAKVYPIFLQCSYNTLLERVGESSRKAYGKITTVEIMSSMIEKYEFDEPAPVIGNTIINTDQFSAIEAASQIKNLAKLADLPA